MILLVIKTRHNLTSAIRLISSREQIESFTHILDGMFLARLVEHEGRPAIVPDPFCPQGLERLCRRLPFLEPLGFLKRRRNDWARFDGGFGVSWFFGGGFVGLVFVGLAADEETRAEGEQQEEADQGQPKSACRAWRAEQMTDAVQQAMGSAGGQVGRGVHRNAQPTWLSNGKLIRDTDKRPGIV